VEIQPCVGTPCADSGFASRMASTPKAGCPLQLVTLNMKERKVEVNEDALARLEKRLREIGAKSIAVVSVMGAFRTGKSFLLDLFLRYLSYEAEHPEEAAASQTAEVPERTADGDYPLPGWITSAGATLEGVTDDAGGFRFRGGMDACTEGIWIWSEPFMRNLNGKMTAVLLMDTQGAWDSNMTKEQSATIFGLTAVISSKQIYNINMQIQEDKVENLAYFMRFAQATIRKASAEMERSGQKLNIAEVDRPFQALDFLVRDWRHFREDWTVAQCVQQMDEHFSRHVDPQKSVENSTAEALHNMFHRLRCFCLPHPGLAIERETWSGKVSDISRDFVRFVDLYVRQVFSEDLQPKNILGSELSTLTFPMVLRDFVASFHDAAPAAMSFTQAMTNCTVLLAKEQAMKSYTKKMDEAITRAPRGLEPKSFEQLNRQITKEVEDSYQSVTIFGSDDTRSETWAAIKENLEVLHKRYFEENSRRLEKALVAFAHLSLLGLVLFLLDRASDWTCDWWSQTCADMSKLMLLAYMGIFAYVGVHAYLLLHDRGRIAAAMAGGELWKEMVRLMGVYADLAQELKFAEVVDMAKKALAGLTGAKPVQDQGSGAGNKKKD
jgi:atlastin